MRADGFGPEGVDAQLGKLVPDALVEFGGVLGLLGVVGEVVDVDVTFFWVEVVGVVVSYGSLGNMEGK